MRLQKGSPIAGIDPDIARRVARAVRTRARSVAGVAWHAKLDDTTALAALGALERDGFLVRHQDPVEGQDKWIPTVKGSALAMASFLKPITRAKADSLLSGLIARAGSWNADPSKPITIDELKVFGSYLNPAVDELGDLDIGITWRWRTADGLPLDIDGLHEYVRESDRQFPDLMSFLRWPETELFRHLTNRSPYIHITEEDLTKLTPVWRSVFTAEAGPPD